MTVNVGFLFCGVFFLLKLIIIYLNISFDLLPLAVEAIKFDETASMLSLYFTELGISHSVNIIKNSYVETPSFTIPLGFLYYIFTDDYVVGFIFNAICSSITAFNVYRLAKVLYNDEEIALSSLFIFSILPYTTVLGTWLYREPLIWLLVTEFFWLIWQYEKRNTVYRLLLLTLILTYAIYIRDENVFLLLPIYLFVLIGGLNVRGVTIISLGFVIGTAVIIFVVLYPERTINYIEKVTRFLSIEHISQRANKHSYQAGAYLTSLKLDSYLDLIYYVPLKALYFLLAPFPWVIVSKTGYFSFMDNLLMLPCYWYYIKNLFKSYDNSKIFCFAANYYILFGIIASGLIQGNVAGAQRHRLQFTILIIALSGINIVNPAKTISEQFKKRFRVLSSAC